jgi:hypothetical protein
MRHGFAACMLVVLLISVVTSQSGSSEVRGTVRLSSGGVVGGATVEARNEATGATFTTVTREDGQYSLKLPDGRYTFKVTLAGFREQVVSGVVVKGSADVDVRMPSASSSASAGSAGSPAGGGNKGWTVPPPAKGGGSLPKSRPPAGGGAEPPTVNRLAWNAWTDEYPGPLYRALPRLQRNKEYLLVLHLAGIAYDAPGVSFQTVSGDISGWADDWIKTGEPTALLQVLALPDSRYFTIASSPVMELSIDLNALRGWSRAPGTPQSDVFAEIRRERQHDGLPPFVFGQTAFRLRTANREGVGAVGLSIWSDKGRPLDEVTLSFCVSDEQTSTLPPICSGIRPVQQTLKGADSVRIAAEGGAAPDAALHFLEIDARGVVGVFRDNTCRTCGYKVWTLNRDGASLRSALANTVLPAFGPSASTTSLPEAGAALYDLLFPDDDNNTDAAEARRAFEAFVTPDVSSPVPRSPSRSIFVRTLLSGDAFARPLYVPLGLVTVPGVPDEFVGFRFRIEAPLERQSYSAPGSCISRWFFAIPPANPTSPEDILGAARTRFEPLMARWQDRLQEQFPTIPALRKWLGQAKPAEASAALLMVSHHDASTLYFDTTEKLTPGQVHRRFGEASVLVLNGCSTGAPMAEDLVRQFNQRGMATIVASQVAVRPQLAGDFVAQFGEILESGDASGQTIADVFLRTIQELRMKKPQESAVEYGPRALVFSLLGNGATRVCSPQKEVR